MKTKTMIKACAGGFCIGLVGGAVLGTSTAAFVTTTALSFAWGAYCGWQDLSPLEKYALRTWSKTKFDGLKATNMGISPQKVTLH